MTTGWTIYEPMFECPTCGEKTRYKLGCNECQDIPTINIDSLEMLRIS